MALVLIQLLEIMFLLTAAAVKLLKEVLIKWLVEM
jgi:hypothetical protein